MNYTGYTRVNNAHETVIELNGQDFDAVVGYNRIPYEKGDYEGGLQLSPNIPAHVELESVQIWVNDSWVFIDLKEEDIDYIMDEIEEGL